MSGVFFLDYVRSLSTCLFKYVFLFILNLSFFLATPCGMWNLSSPTRDGTCVPCNGRRVLNHWTTREVSACLILILSIFNDLLLQKSKYIAWDWKKKYEHLTVMEGWPYVGGHTLSITSFTPETVLKGRHCLLHRWKTDTRGEASCQTWKQARWDSNPSAGFGSLPHHPVTTLWCVYCDKRFYYSTGDEDMAISWFVESQPDWRSPAPLLDSASYFWPNKCLW